MIMLSRSNSMRYVARASVMAALAILPPGPALAGGTESDAANAPAADNHGTIPVPEPVSRAKTLDNLFERLSKATTPVDAAPIKSQIRELWLSSGSATVDLLLTRDAQAALNHDKHLRRELLEAVTRLAPDSPEVWDRRAELDYTEQRFDAAMADLGHVLVAEPRHFDALESLATLLKEIGRNDLALKAFRQLQKLDPTSANLQSEIDDLARKVEGQKI